MYGFMNEIVIHISTQYESKFSGSSLVHASEKAIEAYFHLFHLVLCLATKAPMRVRRANETIKNFLDDKRSETDVPNLGYLLFAVPISDYDMTRELLVAIVGETVTEMLSGCSRREA